MRAAASLLIVCALLGCGRSDSAPAAPPQPFVPAGDAGNPPQATDAGTPADDGGSTAPADSGTPDAGPADGGSDTPDGGTGTPDGGTAAACPEGYEPAADLAVTASSAPACAGIAPEQARCAATIAACAGWRDSGNGPSGSASGGATSDWNGALALHCANVDVGPDPGWAIWAPGPGGWSSVAHLGDDALPMSSGFLALSTSYAGRPPPNWLFFDEQGNQLASIPRSQGGFVSSPVARIFLTNAGGANVARAYSTAGQPQGEMALPPGGWTSAAIDVSGAVLTLVGDGDTAGVKARWMSADGRQALTDTFDLARRPSEIQFSAALPGGGVALGSFDGYGTTPVWKLRIAAGAATAEPPPVWLQSQPNLPLGFVRQARALAFPFYGRSGPGSTSLEVVAADGTSCGTIEVPKGRVSLGSDGTLSIADGNKSFRAYPRLLR